MDRSEPFEASLYAFWDGSKEPFILKHFSLSALILLKIIENLIEVLFIRVILSGYLPF